jgi:hypothetical protein
MKKAATEKTTEPSWNGGSKDGQLNRACETGDLEIVKQIINQKLVKPDENYPYELALMLAASQGHVDIVNFLLLRGANPIPRGTASEDPTAPIYMACKNGRVQVVKILLNALLEKKNANALLEKENAIDTQLIRKEAIRVACENDGAFAENVVDVLTKNERSLISKALSISFYYPNIHIFRHLIDKHTVGLGIPFIRNIKKSFDPAQSDKDREQLEMIAHVIWRTEYLRAGQAADAATNFRSEVLQKFFNTRESFELLWADGEANKYWEGLGLTDEQKKWAKDIDQEEELDENLQQLSMGREEEKGDRCGNCSGKRYR